MLPLRVLRHHNYIKVKPLEDHQELQNVHIIHIINDILGGHL